VVTGLLQRRTGGEDQTATGPGPRRERRREAGLREREAHADVAAVLAAVRRVDPDVDRLVVVGVRADPAADVADVADLVAVGKRDGVDPAAHSALGRALVHRD